MYKLAYRLAALTLGLGASVMHAQKKADTAEPARSAIGVQVLSSSQMQREDADLLSGRRTDVAKAAELYGYDLSSGTWIENQVACQAAPNHLLMHFVRIARDGAVSMFTAVIPRANGQVRIIPILYHGAQAFRVFGSSPQQRALINEVVPTKSLAENPNADWTTLAYCYAALGGTEPASMSLTSQETTSPILALSADGKVHEMHFSVIGPDHLIEDWRILFDGQTQVKSIALSARLLQPPQDVPEREFSSRPVPAPQ